jgi:hypothetical protein
MRKNLPDKLEAGRVRTGPQRSDPSFGPYGKFLVNGPCGARLMIVASGADFAESDGFEHVSVSTERRCPNWIEMCFVKDLFWDDEETVVQFHPPKSRYVNNHEFCLHLWRDVNEPTRLPPSQLVGLKDRGVLSNEERALIWIETTTGP